MHRHTPTICHHNLLDVLLLAYHTLGADIISPANLLNITAAGVLVVVRQSLEYIAYCNLQCSKRIRVNSHLILFEITAETVDFHNARDTRKLTLYNPVLNSAQLHGIVVLAVLLVHLQHILINLTQSRGDRHHLGSAKFLGYLPCHHLYLLVD